MKQDPNIDNDIFEVLRGRGYVRPDLALGLWIKDKFLCRFTYEHREDVRFEFGLADAPVNLHFPNSPVGWWQAKMRPYAFWLKAVEHDPSAFSQACGGDTDKGLLVPNFMELKKIIGDTLEKVENNASNIEMNRDAIQRPLSGRWAP